jgi:chromosomal replication initiation ATPase DnaA
MEENDRMLLASQKVEQLCKLLDVNKETMLSSSRKRRYVHARVLIFKILSLQGYNVYEIANILHRDRTSIVGYFNRFINWHKYDKDFRATFEYLVKNGL